MPNVERNSTPFVEPFSRIFTDRAEADWAFDLLHDTIYRLQVNGPYDARVAVTLLQRSGKHFLHLNFGSWLVLGFREPTSSPERVDMALLANLVAWDERFTTFTSDRKEGEPEVRSYALPLKTINPMTSDLRHAFETTLDFIADKFHTWKRSPRWKHHNPEIIEACFDPAKRALLFTGGLEELELRYERHFTPFTLELAEEGETYVLEDEERRDESEEMRERSMIEGVSMEEQHQAKGYFSESTFQLLTALNQQPSKELYALRKNEFKLYIEDPCKRLFNHIAAQFLPSITEVLETKKRLFSRIPKNDFGQGGAWDFYWAAFYPKGGKRTTDAQLSLWINYERLEVGFYIGEYGAEARQRFLTNCLENYEELITLLTPLFSTEDFIMDPNHEIVVDADGSIHGQLDLTWQQWLKNPDQAGFDLSVVYLKNRVLQLSQTDLVTQITEIYTKLFPLILLTITDSPLPIIKNYLALVSQPSYLSPSPLLPSSPRLPSPTSPYSLDQLAADTHLDPTELTIWLEAIERKKQAILYGPPGTGKTFIAEKLAAHLTTGGDGFVDVVQFHSAYAYEDFIQGIRPHTEGSKLSYPLVPGRFLQFCQQAQQCDDCCVLVIDEINRANLARVFGELMYLLEYRNRTISLAGGGTFQIPANVRLLGTMNTADRSIALVDHALRRRFAFIALKPNFEILRRYHRQQHPSFNVDGLVKVLQRLNREIDDLHYAIGITYFMLPNLGDVLPGIWRMEIEPYLEEYFFDQAERVAAYRWQQIASEILPA